MEHWELSAREAIRDLVARYNANGDSGRFEQVLELFTADAVMELPDGPRSGLEEIRSIFTGVRDKITQGDPSRYLRHITGTHQIDLIDETHARGRCYFLVLTRVGLDHWGRYIDEYQAVDGEWKISRRRVITDGRSPASLYGA